MSRDEAADVVYLILAHDQPAHLARLITRLAGPGARFVIHVDARRNIAPFRAAVGIRPDAIFVPDRVKVRWAAFSQVESTLRAIDLALRRWSHQPSHLVLLSGADYPIRPAEQIHGHLARNRGQQFIRRFDLVRHGDRRQRRRVTRRHFREWADRNNWRRKPLFALEALIGLIPRRLPAGVHLVAGSNWWALTPECAEFCLTTARKNRGFTNFFRLVFAPDEIFFHTLVENSKWESDSRAAEPYYEVTEIGGPWRYGNLHYLNPIEPITDLDVLTDALADEEVQFARKFSETRSAAVLDELDRLIERAR